MSSGERPIGAAKGKQSDTEALCHPPPPPPPPSPTSSNTGPGVPVHFPALFQMKYPRSLHSTTQHPYMYLYMALRHDPLGGMPLHDMTTAVAFLPRQILEKDLEPRLCITEWQLEVLGRSSGLVQNWGGGVGGPNHPPTPSRQHPPFL